MASTSKGRPRKPACAEESAAKVAARVYLTEPTSRRLKRLKAESDRPISTIVEEILTGRREPLSH